MKRRGKKGSLEISFGMIFSIFLIIVFIIAGFYAIKKFLEMQDEIQIKKFAFDLQEDVDAMWKNSEGKQTRTYFLPTKIEQICFFKDSSGLKNLKYVSKDIIPEKMIEHIDVDKTIISGNEFCITNNKGKVKMTLVKEYREVLVTIQE